jgi:hypothetical protein
MNYKTETQFMKLWEQLNVLNEGVSSNNPYIRDAIQMFQNDEDAEGIVVSVKPHGQPEIKVCRLYHSDSELDDIIKRLYNKYDVSDISAFHNRGVIDYYKGEWHKADAKAQKEAQTALDNLFWDEMKKEMKTAGVDYLSIIDDSISEKDFYALYNEYIPKNTPADQDDREKLIKVFVKALKQKLSNKDVSNTVTQDAVEEPAKVEPKNAKLNRARQNNSKIIKAFKEVGLSADDLIATATNKNGKNYRKASDKLNKLRKTLFGESFDEDENPFDQEF